MKSKEAYTVIFQLSSKKSCKDLYSFLDFLCYIFVLIISSFPA